jgi:Ca2+-binding EF-hand superfamily protein
VVPQQADEVMLSSVFTLIKDADGEVHRDLLPRALKLLRMVQLNPTVLREECDKVTTYSTLDFQEFSVFITACKARQEMESDALFRKYDRNGSGFIEAQPLAELLVACGATPFVHVAHEVLQETGEGTGPYRYDTFKRLRDVLRKNEGFSFAEGDTMMAIFEKFDHTRDGLLSLKELLGAIRYLGYAMEPTIVEALANKVSMEGNTSVTRREFLVFMRKARQREIEAILKIFRQSDTDGNPGITLEELSTMLVSLGYLPNDDTVKDAMADAGLGRVTRSLQFDEVWRFLEAYRMHHGFSYADFEEIETVFNNFENGTGYVDISMVAKMLRSMGYPISYNPARLIVAEVDINGAEVMDVGLFIEVVRKYREIHTRKMLDRMLAESSEAIQGLGGVGAAVQFAVPERLDAPSLHPDHEETGERGFLQQLHMSSKDLQPQDVSRIAASVVREYEATRKRVKEQEGFDSEEAAELERTFKGYDKDDSGTIAPSELRPLIQDMFPSVSTDQATYKRLQRLLQEANAEHQKALPFSFFLHLARHWYDICEKEQHAKERIAVRETEFTVQEVAEFRELFVGSDTGDRTGLTLKELRGMLERIAPLGHNNMEHLRSVFRQNAESGSGRTCDFPEFLQVMRRLLDENFAGIAQLKAQCQEPVAPAPTEGEQVRSPGGGIRR